MNLLELAEKWEREAKDCDGFPVAASMVLDCAAELRAALPEQPQEPVAFQFGDNFQYVANFWPPENVGDTSIRPLYAADLEAHESESLELLREALQAIVTIGGVSPRRSGKTHLAQLSDRIRNHLEGDSDEA